jgi:cytochrome c oxidase cbb3-type subunit 2
MKSNLVFFLGLFAALGISWAGVVLGSNGQLGSLPPYFDTTQETAFPQWPPGVAARGQMVYRDLGCAACHTQQVRRPDLGSDHDRGWGDRQSVARDYIYQPFPQLGEARIGPDLTNLGDRKPTAPDEDDLLNLLYTGAEGMPSYRFLFEERRLGSEAQRSDRALKLTGALEPRPGWEVLPTPRALDLVGYLASLKTAFDYPEAVPYVAPKGEGAEAAKPAPATPAKGTEGAAPAGQPAPASAVSPSPAPANSGAKP